MSYVLAKKYLALGRVRDAGIAAITSYEDGHGVNLNALTHYFQAFDRACDLYKTWGKGTPESFVRALDREFCQHPPIDVLKRAILKLPGCWKPNIDWQADIKAAGGDSHG